MFWHVFPPAVAEVPMFRPDLGSGFGSRSLKTFKPKKNIPKGSHPDELPEGFHPDELLEQADATPGSGNLREGATLPEGEDLNERIAVNAADFFNRIDVPYGIVTEFRAEVSSPVTSAGPRYEYRRGGRNQRTNVKKPIERLAPKDVDYVMTGVQDQLDDETLYPFQDG
ncbi:PREDICTED: LOW QUALITY PROTEIN: MOB kinase activator 1A-like, partial [Eurypyga helias]|uniref:LOW QUALITY PROTEIN: MOB kinase activator 1A-like n=1 Tax=Eurypyga helias TaxID=54383 RepID=UPI00052943D7